MGHTSLQDQEGEHAGAGLAFVGGVYGALTFVRQTIQLQTCELAHRLDFVQRILHRRVAEVIKQLHEVNAKHGRQWIRRPTILTLRVITGYLLLQLLPRNQLVHALQKYLATRLALLGLVLGFGEGDLIHGSNESYRFGDGCIITDFGGLFRPSLTKGLL